MFVSWLPDIDAVVCKLPVGIQRKYLAIVFVIIVQSPWEFIYPMIYPARARAKGNPRPSCVSGKEEQIGYDSN